MGERRRKSQPVSASLQIPNTLLEVFGSALGPYGIATYVGLLYFKPSEEISVKVSKKTIAGLIGASPQTVGRSLDVLERLGLVEISIVFDDEGQTSNRYLFLEPPNEVPIDWKLREKPERPRLVEESDRDSRYFRRMTDFGE